MPEPMPKRGYVAVCPDLIVEVISPTDERRDIERKQALYDRMKVPLVWWIDPIRETAAIRVDGRQTQVLDRTGTLDGGDILPGFSLSLEAVFSKG
jgi:Uma2 family endonuclease